MNRRSLNVLFLFLMVRLIDNVACIFVSDFVLGISMIRSRMMSIGVVSRLVTGRVVGRMVDWVMRICMVRGTRVRLMMWTMVC